MSRKITAVVAVGSNMGIGKGGKLPWHLPADLAFFKRYTMGKPMILGRKTFESFGSRPLPGRPHLIISRTLASGEGYRVYPGVAQALAACADAPECIIAGGSEIYAAAFPFLTDLRITEVSVQPDADTYFHWPDRQQWILVSEEHHPSDERNPYAMRFLHFVRDFGEGVSSISSKW
jgi:dihydrofolate reductase